VKIDAHPILSCSAAAEYEQAFFSNGAIAENTMMFRAGRAVAAAIEDDFEEISGFPARGKALVLAGKGHNAGDALICANALLDRHPDLEVLVLLAFPVEDFRPHVTGPYELLRVRSDVRRINSSDDIGQIIEDFAGDRCIDLCIDGIFGMQCRPPLRGAPLQILTAVNRFHAIRLRASIDLPSGIGDSSDEQAFIADFTYATGITKTPLADYRNIEHVGRLRYLDLGFFKPCPELESGEGILRRDILWQLSSLRKPGTHKRNFGHLLILAGSDRMPGACLMSATAAANSGCGLVTVGTVESVAAAGIVSLPEVMWTSVPSRESGLHQEVLPLLEARMQDFSAILIGPGLGRSQEAASLLHEILTTHNKPIVVDADGLVADLTRILRERPKHFAPVVLTPHMGEWERIANDSPAETTSKNLKLFCSENHCSIVLKGPRTRIADRNKVYLSPFGGPVLARGGTGDMLSGIIGSLLSQNPGDPTGSAALGAVWHGRAADCLARAQGNSAVRTTDLVRYLAEALGFRK